MSLFKKTVFSCGFLDFSLNWFNLGFPYSNLLGGGPVKKNTLYIGWNVLIQYLQDNTGHLLKSLVIVRIFNFFIVVVINQLLHHQASKLLHFEPCPLENQRTLS